MNTLQKIALYKAVRGMNEDKELAVELNASDTEVYTLGILETQDVTDDVYHNVWSKA